MNKGVRKSLSRGLVLGINCVYHESSACLMEGANLLAFVEEERFNRVKRAKRSALDNADALPVAAIRYCFDKAGVEWDAVSHIAISYDPDLRRLHPGDDVTAGDWGSNDGEATFLASVRRIPQRLTELAGIDVSERIRWVPHHVAHAASTYLASPYDEAAILSIDGIGESKTALLAAGRGTGMEVLREIPYPHSLGFLWEQVSIFLGLDQYAGPAKLMGLAGYGDPHRYAEEFDRILTIGDGDFRIDNHWTRFRAAGDRLEELFGPAHPRGAEMNSREAHVAAALQAATEKALTSLVDWLYARTGSANLCLAGGVALNCVATGRICRESAFDSIFIQPAANDAGTALGAALHVVHGELGHTDRFVMRHPYWGPSYAEEELTSALDQAGLTYTRCVDVAADAARLIAEGRLIGWFQGAQEIGPRALGNRSIVADPRRANVKDAINLHAKHREYWRPFSPSVLAEHAADWLEVGADSVSHSFMSYTYPVRENRLPFIPAAVHADGLARAQLVSAELNPRYHRLITEYHRLTGVPVVLNTSFNGPEEPIVCSPADAVATFRRTGLDALVLGDFLVTDRLNGKSQ